MRKNTGNKKMNKKSSFIISRSPPINQPLGQNFMQLIPSSNLKGSNYNKRLKKYQNKKNRRKNFMTSSWNIDPRSSPEIKLRIAAWLEGLSDSFESSLSKRNFVKSINSNISYSYLSFLLINLSPLPTGPFLSWNQLPINPLPQSRVSGRYLDRFRAIWHRLWSSPVDLTNCWRRRK